MCIFTNHSFINENERLPYERTIEKQNLIYFISCITSKLHKYNDNNKHFQLNTTYNFTTIYDYDIISHGYSKQYHLNKLI